MVHTEMPFLWRMNNSGCLEGVVDLALFESVAKKWFIVDWKTNEITPGKIEKLRAHYLPQIAAYWKAIREMTGMEVEAAIYSTCTAAFLLYKPQELLAEWERLKVLSPRELAAQIAVDQESSPEQLEFSEFSDSGEIAAP